MGALERLDQDAKTPSALHPTGCGAVRHRPLGRHGDVRLPASPAVLGQPHLSNLLVVLTWQGWASSHAKEYPMPDVVKALLQGAERLDPEGT